MAMPGRRHREVSHTLGNTNEYAQLTVGSIFIYVTMMIIACQGATVTFSIIVTVVKLVGEG